MHNHINRILIFCLFFVSVSSAQDLKKNIAVLDLNAIGVSKVESITLTDRLRGELVNSGFFNVIEREVMEQILKEQGFQQTGCTSNECAVEAGKLLNVQQICAGSVGKVGTLYTINIRVINVETGQIIVSVNEENSGPVETLLTKSIKNIVDKLIEALIPKGIISILSEPSGLLVKVNGEVVGKTPIDLTRNYGNYQIIINDPLYETVNEKTVLDKPKIRKYYELKYQKGTIQIKGSMVGVNILIDGKKQDSMNKEFPVNIGAHTIKFQKPGYNDKDYELSILPDQVYPLNIRLKPKTKTAAFTRSLLIPGWGQTYQHKYVRGWLYPLFFAGGVAASIVSTSAYNKSVHDYNEIRQNYIESLDPQEIERLQQEMFSAYDEVENKEKTRNICYMVTGGIWLWNVLDTILLPPDWNKDFQLTTSSDPNKFILNMAINFN